MLSRLTTMSQPARRRRTRMGTKRRILGAAERACTFTQMYVGIEREATAIRLGAEPNANADRQFQRMRDNVFDFSHFDRPTTALHTHSVYLIRFLCPFISPIFHLCPNVFLFMYSFIIAASVRIPIRVRSFDGLAEHSLHWLSLDADSPRNFRCSFGTHFSGISSRRSHFHWRPRNDIKRRNRGGSSAPLRTSRASMHGCFC